MVWLDFGSRSVEVLRESVDMPMDASFVSMPRQIEFPTEAADLYRARSPIHAVDLLSTPMLLLQGAEDVVVPPSQAEVMVEALRAKRLPYAYLLFEGEQHGFRMAASIERSYEAELSFYGQVLGFEPADDIPVLPIENLDDRVT